MLQPGDDSDGGARSGGEAEDDLELDLDADPGGSGEEDEVWFEAEALERASTVQLDGPSHRLLRPAFDHDLLEPRRAPVWLSAATLPGPPSAGPWGHGLGASFDRAIGGLGAGHTVWVRADAVTGGAARHLLGQLAEGFAHASAEGATDPVTPGLVMTSSPRRDAQLWAVSRWTGFAQRIYRLGRRGAMEIAGDAESDVDGAFAAARVSLDGKLGRCRPYLRHVDGEVGLRDGELVAHVTDAVSAWRDELLADGARDAVPVVVIEDLEAWVGRRRDGRSGADAVASLWAALSSRAHAHRWVLLVHAVSGPPAGLRPTPTTVALTLKSGRNDPRRLGLELARLAPAAAPARDGVVELRWDPETGRVAPEAGEDPALRGNGSAATHKE